MQLGDIATYVNGYAFKPAEYSSYGKPIIRIQNLTGNAYQTNKFNGELSEKYAIHSGDVLISWSASLGVFEWKGEDAWLNQHIFKVVFDKVSVDKRYFIHHSRHAIAKGAGSAHGSTMKHLTKKTFEALPFYYPKLNDQKKIATKLDLIQDQIEEARKALAHFNSLVKSRFVEMFGRPMINEYGWDEHKLSDVFEIIDGDRGKNYPKSEDFSSEGYCLFLNAGNVTKEGFSFFSNQFISRERDELLRKGKLKRYDLVVTTRGTVGNIAYYDDGVPFENMRINSGMVILRPLVDINPTYFISYFRNPRVCSSLISGTAQPQMPIRNMRKAIIMMPPMSLQNQFSDFVQQVDKSKSIAQKQIEKLQMLYDSLAQKYFGD